tara:strand:- start:108 stop:509 length:402 start_codon:yes stop_codon:yes gene_type:complete
MIKKIYYFILENLFDIKAYKWFLCGATSSTCDYFLYTFLIDYIQLDFAKFLGVLLGMQISYFLNRIWTFNSKLKVKPELKRFILLYSLCLLINVVINNIAYGLSRNITLSFMITLFITALIGFIGQKYWVFRN